MEAAYSFKMSVPSNCQIIFDVKSKKSLQVVMKESCILLGG
jgi:hypothetical protein